MIPLTPTLTTADTVDGLHVDAATENTNVDERVRFNASLESGTG